MTTPYVGTLPGDLFRLLARAPLFAAFHARDINTGFRYGFGWKEGVFDLIQSAALHKWFEQDRTLQRHFDHCYQ